MVRIVSSTQTKNLGVTFVSWPHRDVELVPGDIVWGVARLVPYLHRAGRSVDWLAALTPEAMGRITHTFISSSM